VDRSSHVTSNHQQPGGGGVNPIDNVLSTPKVVLHSPARPDHHSVGNITISEHSSYTVLTNSRGGSLNSVGLPQPTTSAITPSNPDTRSSTSQMSVAGSRDGRPLPAQLNPAGTTAEHIKYCLSAVSNPRSGLADGYYDELLEFIVCNTNAMEQAILANDSMMNEPMNTFIKVVS